MEYILVIFTLLVYFVNSEDAYYPAAFGDFDSDGLQDAVVVNGKYTKWAISYALKKPNYWYNTPEKCDSNLSVITGDFNGDHIIDVSFSCRQSVKLYLGHPQNQFNGKNYTEFITRFKDGHPLAVDITGKQVTQLLVNTNTKVQIYTYQGNTVTIDATDIDPTSAHAYVDVVGDILPDLVFLISNTSEKSFVVFENKGTHFMKHCIVNINKNWWIGQPTYADVLSTGKLNLVLPVCIQDCAKSSTVQMYFFQTQTWTSIAELSNGYMFPNSPLRIIPEIYRKVWLRYGDFNYDGCPDFVVVVAKGTNTYIGLLICESTSHYKFSTLSVQNPQVATVIDSDTEVQSQILYTKDGTVGMFKEVPMKNKERSFLKISIADGKCRGTRCSISGKENYAAGMLPGNSIEYSMPSLSGDSITSKAGILIQSGQFALQTPYVVLGLGQTPNFITSLRVTCAGLSLSEKPNTKVQENVIPNAVLVLIPSKPQTPSQWVFLLKITAQIEILFKTFLAFTGLCVVFVILILLLTYREKVENDLEIQRQREKMFAM